MLNFIGWMVAVFLMLVLFRRIVLSGTVSEKDKEVADKIAGAQAWCLFIAFIAVVIGAVLSFFRALFG
jgi:hypothetical protein